MSHPPIAPAPAANPAAEPADAPDLSDIFDQMGPEEAQAFMLKMLGALSMTGKDETEELGQNMTIPTEKDFPPDLRPYYARMMALAEKSVPFSKENVLRCLPPGRRADLGHFFDLPPEVLRAMEHGTKHVTAPTRLVVDHPPCCAHDEDHEHPIDEQPDAVKACKCGVVRYHPGDCQRRTWKEHKNFCKEVQAKPELRAFYQKIFRHTGLHPTLDGKEWRAVPALITDEARDAIKSWVAATCEVDPAGAGKQEGPFGVDSVYNCFAPEETTYSTSLRQPHVKFHDCKDGPAYFLMPPGRVPDLIASLEAYGITDLFDPMTGSGAFPATLCAGGFPAERLRGSDLSPSKVKYFPVAAADALNAGTYRWMKKGSTRAATAVVMSWPDFPHLPPVSLEFIRLMCRLKIRWLLVMVEEPGCAMHPDGHKLLEEKYERVPLEGQPDFKITKPSLGSTLFRSGRDTAGSGADADSDPGANAGASLLMFYGKSYMQCVWQRIALYRLRE